MKCFIRYLLCLSMLMPGTQNAWSNVIDSLSGKEDVRSFLAAKLGHKGLICLSACAEISRTEKERMYFSRYFHRFDSVKIQDPVSLKWVKTVVKNDSDSFHSNPETRPYNYPFDSVGSTLERTDWHFYKADIDGNGLTDLVIDAGLVIVVMDMGDSIEGHLFSAGDWPTYSFKRFLSLPGGGTALILRHDHNPFTSVAHSNLSGQVTYITASNTVDTLYKITTGTGMDPIMMAETNYADTVDMHLYNKMDTIVYNSCGFTTFKPVVVPGAISKIDYYYVSDGDVTGPINGYSCLEINKNGRCYLRYKEFDTTLAAILDTTRLKKLWNFASNIDIKSKNDRYVCDAVDGEGAIFAVYFDDGTVKKMSFWEYRPPMDLGYLSKALSDISKAMNWQQSEKPRDFQCPCILPSLPIH